MAKLVFYQLNENNTINRISSHSFEGRDGYFKIEEYPFKWHKNFSKVVDGVFYLREEEFQQLTELKRQRAEILKWLSDNDWKINKVVLGEWTENDVRWSDYLNRRAEKRQRLDEIDALIAQYEYEM